MKSSDYGSENMNDLVNMSDDALDTEDETVDLSCDLNSTIMSDTDDLVDNFCEDSKLKLDWDDNVSLGFFVLNTLL